MDGTVRLWDTTTWKEAAVLKHGANVYGLSFTSDGKRLACACANNTIRLWDMATHKVVGELHGHAAYVHQVAFSPDGTRLVSGSGDSTVRVWDTLSVQERARKSINRVTSR
jgi:WD40 repeat protein